jgi:hypothetical protein
VSTRYETLNQPSVTVAPANGHKFKTEGVTCITLIDGLIVGKTMSNGRLVPFGISGFRVFKKWVAEANAQERAVMKRIIEEAEG